MTNSDTPAANEDDAPITIVRLTSDAWTAPDGAHWWLLEVPAIEGQTREWGAMLHESHVAQLVALVAGLERLKAAIRAQREEEA